MKIVKNASEDALAGQLHFRPTVAQLSTFGKRRAAGEIGERGVADVLQVFDAGFAGVEGVAGHLAKARKKSDPLGK